MPYSPKAQVGLQHGWKAYFSAFLWVIGLAWVSWSSARGRRCNHMWHSLHLFMRADLPEKWPGSNWCGQGVFPTDVDKVFPFIEKYGSPRSLHTMLEEYIYSDGLKSGLVKILFVRLQSIRPRQKLWQKETHWRKLCFIILSIYQVPSTSVVGCSFGNLYLKDFYKTVTNIKNIYNFLNVCWS